MVRSLMVLRSIDIAKSKKIAYQDFNNWLERKSGESAIFQNYELDLIKTGLLSLRTVVLRRNGLMRHIFK